MDSAHIIKHSICAMAVLALGDLDAQHPHVLRHLMLKRLEVDIVQCALGLSLGRPPKASKTFSIDALFVQVLLNFTHPTPSSATPSPTSSSPGVKRRDYLENRAVLLPVKHLYVVLTAPLQRCETEQALHLCVLVGGGQLRCGFLFCYLRMVSTRNSFIAQQLREMHGGSCPHRAAEEDDLVGVEMTLLATVCLYAVSMSTKQCISSGDAVNCVGP